MEGRSGKLGRWSFTVVLLVRLFVQEAAAIDCPKLNLRSWGMEGLALTDETLLLSLFPDGVKITLECGHGHRHDSGSNIMTCVNGEWTKPEMICKKRDCGVPTPKPNMTFNTTRGTLLGAVAKVTCDKGYRIEGVSYIECYPTGWKGRTKCEIVLCPQPVKVTNAVVKWLSLEAPKYGDVVEYVCVHGYTAVGSTILTCTRAGRYDHDPPKCEDATTKSEDRTSTKMAPTTPSIQETSVSASATTAQRDKALTSPATPRRGNRGAVDLTPAPTGPSTIMTVFGGSLITGIIVITVVLLIGVVAGIVSYKFFLSRNGSYDTREDLKPELLRFQNL